MKETEWDTFFFNSAAILTTKKHKVNISEEITISVCAVKPKPTHLQTICYEVAAK